MNDIERIYSLLLHSNGLKIRAISQELELDKYYVAEIMFSSQNIPYWYQDDDSLWYAKEGALQIEEPKEEKDELTAPAENPKLFNIDRFLQDDISDSLRAYLHQISRFRVYTNNEIIELFRRYRDGDKKAFDLLVKCHQRLVANIAFLYNHKGVSLEDLIQEGNIGLINAIKRFDDTRYYSFANYAKAWILQAISNSMAVIPYMVRLPFSQLSLYRKILRLKEKYEQIHEMPPSTNIVETGENIDIEKFTTIFRLPDDLKEMVTIYEDMDFLENEIDLFVLRENQEYNRSLALTLLNSLDERDSSVLKAFYGIDTSEESLMSIGEKMNLTRERTRQIVANSILFLRKYVFQIRNGIKNNYKISKKSTPKDETVVYTKKKDNDSTILIVKESGNTYELPIDEVLFKVKTVDNRNTTQTTPTDPKETSVKTNKPSTMTVCTKEQKSCEVTREAMVGDRIVYNSRYCIVIDRIKKYNIVHLTVKYDDGKIDIVLGDMKRYKVLS